MKDHMDEWPLHPTLLPPGRSCVDGKLPRSAALSVVVALLGFTAPGGAQAQGTQPAPLTPEEQAAIVIYDEGKTLYDEGAYEQALEKLLKAHAVVNNKWIRNRLGLTYAALERCDDALPLLVEVRGEFGETEAVRTEAEVRCRVQRAQKALAEYRCREAVDDLTVLDDFDLPKDTRRPVTAMTEQAKQCVGAFDTGTAAGQRAARLYAEGQAHLRAKRLDETVKAARSSLDARPTPEARLLLADALLAQGLCDEALGELSAVGGTPGYQDRLGQSGAVERCLPTTEALGAFRLFASARRAESEREWKRAAALYRKALILDDRPYIRRGLAGLYLGTRGCAPAMEELSAIPSDQRLESDRQLQEVCSRFAPKGLVGPRLEAFVDALRRALAARRRGEPERARQMIVPLLASVETAELWTLDADLAFEAAQCDDYLAIVKQHWRERARLTDADGRVAACESSNARTRSASAPSLDLPATAGAAAEITQEEPLGSGYATGGWVCVGGGLAVAAAGGVLGGMFLAERDKKVAASQVGATEQRVESYGVAAWVMLGAGGAAAITGVVLLLLPGDEPQEPLPAADTTVALHPILGPGLLGVGGSF